MRPRKPCLRDIAQIRALGLGNADRERDYVRDFRRAALRSLERVRTRTFLYVIREAEGAVKFGIAVNPRERLATLQQGNPRPLALVLVIPASIAFERFVHTEIAEYRLAGEWFRPEGRVLTLIQELRAVAEICVGLEDADMVAEVEDVEDLYREWSAA